MFKLQVILSHSLMDCKSMVRSMKPHTVSNVKKKGIPKARRPVCQLPKAGGGSALNLLSLKPGAHVQPRHIAPLVLSPESSILRPTLNNGHGRDIAKTLVRRTDRSQSIGFGADFLTHKTNCEKNTAKVTAASQPTHSSLNLSCDFLSPRSTNNNDREQHDSYSLMNRNQEGGAAHVMYTFSGSRFEPHTSQPGIESVERELKHCRSLKCKLLSQCVSLTNYTCRHQPGFSMAGEKCIHVDYQHHCDKVVSSMTCSGGMAANKPLIQEPRYGCHPLCVSTPTRKSASQSTGIPFEAAMRAGRTVFDLERLTHPRRLTQSFFDIEIPAKHNRHHRTNVCKDFVSVMKGFPNQCQRFDTNGVKNLQGKVGCMHNKKGLPMIEFRERIMRHLTKYSSSLQCYAIPYNNGTVHGDTQCNEDDVSDCSIHHEYLVAIECGQRWCDIDLLNVDEVFAFLEKTTDILYSKPPSKTSTSVSQHTTDSSEVTKQVKCRVVENTHGDVDRENAQGTTMPKNESKKLEGIEQSACVFEPPSPKETGTNSSDSLHQARSKPVTKPKKRRRRFRRKRRQTSKRNSNTKLGSVSGSTKTFQDPQEGICIHHSGETDGIDDTETECCLAKFEALKTDSSSHISDSAPIATDDGDTWWRQTFPGEANQNNVRCVCTLSEEWLKELLTEQNMLQLL